MLLSHENYWLSFTQFSSDKAIIVQGSLQIVDKELHYSIRYKRHDPTGFKRIPGIAIAPPQGLLVVSP